jgi:hypothetical protein
MTNMQKRRIAKRILRSKLIGKVVTDRRSKPKPATPKQKQEFALAVERTMKQQLELAL